MEGPRSLNECASEKAVLSALVETQARDNSVMLKCWCSGLAYSTEVNSMCPHSISLRLIHRKETFCAKCATCLFLSALLEHGDFPPMTCGKSTAHNHF